jgi:hypothetical protein
MKNKAIVIQAVILTFINVLSVCGQEADKGKFTFKLIAGVHNRTIPIHSSNIVVNPNVTVDKQYASGISIDNTIKGMGMYAGLGIFFNKIQLSLNYKIGLRYGFFHYSQPIVETNTGVITTPVKTLISDHHLYLEKYWGKKLWKAVNTIGISFMNQGTDFGEKSKLITQSGFSSGYNLKYTAIFGSVGVAYRYLKLEIKGYYTPNLPYIVLDDRTFPAFIPEINLIYNFNFPFPKSKTLE